MFNKYFNKKQKQIHLPEYGFSETHHRIETAATTIMNVSVPLLSMLSWRKADFKLGKLAAALSQTRSSMYQLAAAD